MRTARPGANMNNFLKLLGYLILVVLALGIAFWAIQTAVSLVMGILYALIPLALVAGVAYLVYRAVRRKALGGGGRSLP
jgi:F0F1-type ATP synthase assembly protein I